MDDPTNWNSNGQGLRIYCHLITPYSSLEHLCSFDLQGLAPAFWLGKYYAEISLLDNHNKNSKVTFVLWLLQEPPL